MQSGPEALPNLRKASTLWTLQTEIMVKRIKLERGLVGGSGTLELSTEELVENREQKRFVF